MTDVSGNGCQRVLRSMSPGERFHLPEDAFLGLAPACSGGHAPTLTGACTQTRRSWQARPHLCEAFPLARRQRGPRQAGSGGPRGRTAPTASSVGQTRAASLPRPPVCPGSWLRDLPETRGCTPSHAHMHLLAHAWCTRTHNHTHTHTASHLETRGHTADIDGPGRTSMARTFSCAELREHTYCEATGVSPDPDVQAKQPQLTCPHPSSERQGHGQEAACIPSWRAQTHCTTGSPTHRLVVLHPRTPGRPVEPSRPTHKPHMSEPGHGTKRDSRRGCGVTASCADGLGNHPAAWTPPCPCGGSRLRGCPRLP